MKRSLFAFSCILLGVVACAPQGKKLGANSTGLAPVAEGPAGSASPAMSASKAAVISETQKGQTVGIYNQGSVTVTLASAQQDGYSWRLAEIPDPTVLKLVSQDFTPPASGVGRGQEKWVFQAVGPGDVDVKMWYGNLRETPVTNNPNFNFIASVSNESGPVKKIRSEIRTKTKKKVGHTVARAF